MPRLPELQEMDNKQLNESLSQFYTEAPGKKDDEYSKWSLISFFLNLLAKLFGKEFQGHFVLMIFYKGSSQNGRRFHFNSRFEPIREFVLIRRKSMFT